MLDFFLKNKIRVALKKQTHRQRSFLNFSVIKRVFILFDYDNWSEVKLIVDDLIKNKKEVVLWTVTRAPIVEEQQDQSYGIRIINQQKDLKWTRTLRADIESEYEKLEYDTFLDLSFSDDPLMLYLKVKNQSKFSIGLHENAYRLYNFVLLKEENRNLFETYEQIKFYLTANT